MKIRLSPQSVKYVSTSYKNCEEIKQKRQHLEMGGSKVLWQFFNMIIRPVCVKEIVFPCAMLNN